MLGASIEIFLTVLPNNPFASCSLVNLGFLLLQPHSLKKALFFHFFHTIALLYKYLKSVN